MSADDMPDLPTSRTGSYCGIAERLFSDEQMRAYARKYAAEQVAKEREACAETCEVWHNAWRFGDSPESGPMDCAKSIRARGEPQ